MPVLPLYDEPLSDEAKPDQPFSDEPKPDHAQRLVNRFHNSVRESMPGIIFSERDSPNMDMPALVIWVLEDCSKIPGIPYFFDVYRKLEKVLENDGLGDHPNHHVIIVDQEVDSKEFSQSFLDLRQEYMSCCINLEIAEGKSGERNAKFNTVLISFLIWAFSLSAFLHKTRNAVVISSNKNFGQGTKFSDVRASLWNKGFQFCGRKSSYFAQYGFG